MLERICDHFSSLPLPVSLQPTFGIICQTCAEQASDLLQNSKTFMWFQSIPVFCNLADAASPICCQSGSIVVPITEIPCGEVFKDIQCFGVFTFEHSPDKFPFIFK